MFVLGHLGLTLTAARRARREIDLRAAALLALLPDLVDKPLRELAPSLVNRSTRSFGHSLAGAAVALVVLLALRRRWGDPLTLWACWLGHLALDLMWLGAWPAVLFWPLLGPFPRHAHDLEPARLWAYNLAGEAAGAALLLRLGLRRLEHDTNR